eukprot:31167-Pelagococcus_subviridis.AAC.3
MSLILRTGVTSATCATSTGTAAIAGAAERAKRGSADGRWEGREGNGKTTDGARWRFARRARRDRGAVGPDPLRDPAREVRGVRITRRDADSARDRPRARRDRDRDARRAFEWNVARSPASETVVGGGRTHGERDGRGLLRDLDLARLASLGDDDRGARLGGLRDARGRRGLHGGDEGNLGDRHCFR